MQVFGSFDANVLSITISQSPKISRERGAEPTRQLRIDLGQAAYWRLVREGYQQERSLSALITELLMKQGSEKALKGRIRRNETAKAKRDQKRAADVEIITSWGLDPKRRDASLRWPSLWGLIYLRSRVSSGKASTVSTFSADGKGFLRFI